MFRWTVLARTSKLRRPLNPEPGSLKFLSVYPSSRKLKSVPQCVNGDGAGVGAGVCVGVGAGVGAGVDSWAKHANAISSVAEPGTSNLIRFTENLLVVCKWSLLATELKRAGNP